MYVFIYISMKCKKQHIYTYTYICIYIYSGGVFAEGATPKFPGHVSISSGKFPLWPCA